ncbi:MAG TPA: DUF5662 family protein [Phormidium sp.]
MLTDSQKITNYETLKHIEIVMQLLGSMQNELLKRMFTHDRSKLETPELEMFEQFTSQLAGLTYGSDEYKTCLEQMKAQALGHHYEHNRHHPEHFEDCPRDPQAMTAIAATQDLINKLKHLKAQNPSSEDTFGYSLDIIIEHQKTLESNVNAMNLIDILELLCDWYAACKRHNDGDIHKSIEINTERFGLSPQLKSILLNTVPLLQKDTYHQNTQKHLD